MDNLIRLYESTEKAFTSGGLGCLSDATKCVVSEERNGEYELELEYPINGIHYSDIAIRRIILCQPNPYDRPQPFRIYSISRPIKGIVTVNAAHVCYDLSNYVCFPFIATSSSEVFDRLNGSHSEQETSRIYPEDILYDSTTNPHGFQFTTDMSVSFPAKAQSQKPEPEDERFKVLIPKPIKTVLGTNDDCILGRFINSSGHRGEYYYDRFHIYLKDPDGNSPRGRKNSGFEIRYGKNMTKVEKEETTKEDYTHILPFWKAVQSSDTTVAVLGGEGVAPVVAVPGATGRSDVKIKIVDLSSEFDKKPNATKLTQYAQDYINDNELTGQASTTITVNFQSLSRNSEYSSYSNLEDVRLCDTVKVIYEALGVNDEKKVIRTDYNVLLQQYDEIEIGDPRDELASTIGNASTTATNTQDAGATVKQGLVETITNAIKLSQVIYYLDTTGQFSEDDPPEPPEAGTWVTESRAIANTWTITEPVCDEDGELFTYSQNRLTDDTINLSDFSFARLATTIRGWVTGDDADEIDGEQLYNQSVNTAAIHDEAITSEKLEVNAVQSRTYTAGSDAHFSTTGTLINLAGSGYIRSKNFAIDSNGNAYFKGQINALSGSIGTADDGFTINSNNIEGTYSAGSDSYNIIIETDGTIMMRPASFVRAGAFTSTVLNEADLRMSSYHDDIGFYDQIDIASTADSIGIGFYRGINSSLTDNVSVKEFAIDGLHREAIGTIEADPNNNNITTSGKWILSSDTYISGHNNQTLKAWIEAIEASGYVLPPATTSTLGGVIVGSNLSVTANGTLSVNTNTIATRAWVTWDNLGSKPFATIGTSSGLKVDSGSNLVINYGTGLTTNNSDQLVVDTSTIATRTWVQSQGYLTSVSWSNVQNKPFNDIAEHAGLVVSNNLLEIDAGTGLTFDDDSNAIKIDSTVVALKTDIHTYTGEKGITVSNSYAIGHTNTYTAKSTQALYPIKIDSYGHISAVGDAVTIPTIPGADRGISLVSNKYGHSNTAITAVNTNGFYKIKFDAYGHITGYVNYTLLNGLELDSSNRLNVLLQASNSGLLFDDDGNHGLAIDPTYVALKSDIPTVNNATLTIQKNGTTVKTFTANASSNVTANITVPTKTSDLTNDSGFITGISWANVGSKPFDNIGDDGLTVVTTNNVKYLKVLLAESGAGLTFDSEGNHGLMIDSTVALKTDIPTYIGEKGITVSNAHAIGHTNTYTAKTTQAVYPIKIDTYGHISAVGNAVTIPTITLNGSATTSPSFYAPTGAGTSGQYLKSSGSGAPTWANFPTIPTVNDATLTIQKNGTNVATFTANASSNVTANITIGWSDVNNKPFVSIAEHAGLAVNNNALEVEAGNGLTFDDESNALIVDTSVVALKSDIKTYTGEKGISVSNTNAIGHSNTAITPVTTAGLYKIKMDTYGHITGYTAYTDLNYYHTTGSWNGLTYTATANGGAGALAFTIPTGSNSTTVSRGDHTHDISIEATGSDPVNLSANTTYTLTAGGKSLVIKTPADANTATAADNILDGSNSGTQITYAPYSATTATSTWVGTDSNAGKLYLGTQAPSKTTRLNYNGYLYATKLYSGGTEVSVSGHSHTITANATDGIFDITGTNGTNSVTYAVAPYSSQQSKQSFDTSSTAPTRSDRLNYNGYFYATKLYSGGTEVSVSGHSHAWSAITGKPFDQVDEDKGLEVITSSSVKYLGIKLGADLKFDSESGEVTHTNSVTAQTTQALYPIKIDAKGHISAYGTAVTVPSASSTVTAVSTTASAGSASTYSKGDHTHSISLATGDSNGQVKIAGTNVSVKGLGAMAYKASVAFSDLPTLYWANVAVASASATNKSPQFADMTATNVKLYASSAVKATMTYNTTTDAIDFNFA